ncbi:hypothetical protein DS745_03535 [Anaerobacillus alkaliphilus]|uniref:Uncharacterized protein n=1 Tax=Anaerobacillus alkaliphilus TaxID=1548597 RepID=A0A4Q0VY29_9BACI|nr:hypothetical protein [Anaerobacillus alkaliphilus]RXJ04469.1 hypothetical protein DS745_03535 [Anaerobacillus alkaliphilus]
MKINKPLILFVLLIASLVVNYILYIDNSGFKGGHGAEYQLAVRQAIYTVNEGEFSYVIDGLTDGNDLPFEMWKRDIAFLNTKLHKTGNINFKILGDYLNHIPRQLEVLAESNVYPDNEIENIKSQVVFFHEILSKVDADLGEDQMKWFREVSSDNSKTS